MEARKKIAGLIAQLEQKQEIINQLTSEIKNLLNDLYNNECTDKNN